MEYCFYCDQHIDTDFDAEHFIVDKDHKIVSCVREVEE